MSEQVAVLRRRIKVLEDEAEITRRLACFDASGTSKVRIYRFIAVEAANFSVTVLCRVCGVSRSAYYAWLGSDEVCDQEVLEEAYLADRIFDLWWASRKNYGVPRITAQLWRDGVQVNAKKVERIMGELGICGRSGRRKMVTTRRDPSHEIAGDLVERRFSADRPDELWVTDITYLHTDEGFVYVAAILDVYSRVVLGWSIAAHMRTDLCLDALDAAAKYRGRRRFTGTVLHSDHGCQFTSDRFKVRCTSLGITQSMGTVGDSYDNAMAESLWASLKREAIDYRHFTTLDEARQVAFEWIVWYNNTRLHSSVGHVPPVEFDNAWSCKASA